MSVTVFSFIMSVLWCDIFIIISYLLGQRKNFLLYFSIYPILFLMLASLFRSFFYFEFPFATIIHSNTIYPAIVAFLNTTIISFMSGTVTVNMVAIFFAIWVIGSACSFYRIISLHTRFLKAMSQEQETQEKRIHSIMDEITCEYKPEVKIKIIQTTLVSTPIIAGFFKPTIYLPDIPLSDGEMYLILLHEWTHYLHKDLWIKLLIQIICAIYWWNPVIYVLKHNLNHTLEIKSDLNVTSKMSEESKFEYLETILKIAKNLNEKEKVDAVPTVLELVTSNKGKGIKQRFYMILDFKPKKSSQKLIATLFYSFTVILLVVSYLFIIQPNIEPPSSERDNEIFRINPDNAYLIDNTNSTYSLYIDGQYILDIDDITLEPYSTLSIK